MKKHLHPYPYCDVLFPIPFNYRTRKARLAKNDSPKKCQKLNKFIKYFVEINKNEVNKNCRQKTNENV
jgi:hypothetical protein